jgi:hypothetical protein
MSEPKNSLAIVPVRVKLIPLTQGQFAIVDDFDYLWLSKWKWRALKTQREFYAVTWGRPHGAPYSLAMHAIILGTNGGDHIDGNGLNNTRRNLRPSTTSQNGVNRRLNRNSNSGFKGVTWRASRKHWRAVIKAHGRAMDIGTFKDPTEAAMAYDSAAIKLFGEFARTNAMLGLIPPA